jgi:hypothetical protein
MALGLIDIAIPVTEKILFSGGLQAVRLKAMPELCITLDGPSRSPRYNGKS